MKRALFSLLITLVGFVSVFPSPALAHYEESDGSMTVTLHITPNDNPIPGKESNLYFLFDDTTKKFHLENCLCTVSISENDKGIFKKQLTKGNYTKPILFNANLPFTFPDRNTYEISMSGTPIQPNAFVPFSVSWDYNVDPDNFPGVVPERPNDVPTIIAGITAILIFFSFFGWFLKKQILDHEAPVTHKKKKD